MARIVGIALLVATSGVVAAYWFQLLPQILHGNPDVGRDFAVFHTAGALTAKGKWHTLYDMAAFAGAYDSATGLRSIVGGPVFRYPPSTALVLAPLSLVGLSTALAVWTALAPVGLLVSLKLLGARLRLFFPILLSAPAVIAVYLGQNSILMLAILSAAAFFVRKGRSLPAGICLGLLALKPQLVVGILLWLLVGGRERRRELAAFSATVATLLSVSLVTAFPAWQTYLTSFTTLAAPPNVVGFGYFSGLDFVRFLFGSARSQTVLVVWGIAVMIIAWLLIIALRKASADSTSGLALAVLGSLLLSPHLVAYDWLLLVVPGVLLWQRFTAPRARILLWSGVLSFTALTSSEAVALSLHHFGWAVSPAFAVLVFATYAAVHVVTRASQEPSSGERFA